MKTTILASFVIAGFLGTSAAQAGMNAGTNLMVEEIYSGLSADAIQQIHQNAAEQRTASKATCRLHQAEEDVDPLYAAYPGDNYTEKDYLAPSNFNFEC